MIRVSGSIGALVLALLCASLAGCHGGTAKLKAFLQTPRSPVSATEYRVLPPDVLQITSIHVPDINNLRQQVRPDGKINLPLIGEIYVADHTPKEIEELLKKASKEYYEQVDATVQVAEYRSQKIYVFGQVSRPGPLPWTGNDTLLDVLATVQPTPSAWPEEIHVSRGKPPMTGGYWPAKYLKKHPELQANDEPPDEDENNDEYDEYDEEAVDEALPPPETETGKPPELKGKSESFKVAKPECDDLAKATKKAEKTALQPDGEAHVMVINLMKMIQNGDLSRNVLLKPNDVIYVPPNPLAAMGLAMQQLLLGIQPAAQTIQVPASALYSVRSAQNIGSSKAVP
jgi:protein involved in polysaccharide export with SLBB domain